MRHIIKVINMIKDNTILKKSFFIFFLCILICLSLIITPNVQAKSKIALNHKSATILKGETIKLKLTGSTNKVKWSSSDSKIAKVSQKGKVTARKVGTTKITAKMGNKKFTCKIKVENPKVYGKSFTLAPPTEFLLCVVDTTLPVKWKSQNSLTAKVSSKGVVTAISPGVTTITAKVSNKTFKFKINVVSSISSYDGNVIINE